MELDEMKQMWQQYDKVLQENKMLNEQLVNHLLKDKSKNVISKLVNMEYLGIVICVLVLLFLAVNLSPIYASALMSGSYFLSVSLAVAAIIFSLYKLKHLNSINLSANTVTDTAEKMQRFRVMISMERLISVIITPILLLAFFAVVMFIVHDVDVFEDITVWMPRILVALVVAIVVMLLLYRSIYFQNIKQVMDNLKEIEQFRKE